MQDDKPGSQSTTYALEDIDAVERDALRYRALRRAAIDRDPNANEEDFDWHADELVREMCDAKR